MWLAIVIAAVVLFIGCVVYLEFFRRKRDVEVDRTTDKSTNYKLIQARANNIRNGMP